MTIEHCLKLVTQIQNRFPESLVQILRKQLLINLHKVKVHLFVDKLINLVDTVTSRTKDDKWKFLGLIPQHVRCVGDSWDGTTWNVFFGILFADFLCQADQLFVADRFD